MILIHIIRRKKKKILPTHIKHNSSKIITIIITITYTNDNITWTFCTISFKLAIDCNISKEFLRSIDLFSIEFFSNLRSVVIFQKEFLWSIDLLSVEFLSNLWSIVILQRNFCDQSIYSLYNFRGPGIDQSKFSKKLAIDHKI